MTLPAISVVVATRDRHERLVRLLDSLARQSLDQSRFEVVVVDDGSRDGTGDALAAAAESLPIALRSVPGPGGRGPAAARNRGWRAAEAALIAFTDDDCEASEDWLEKVLERAQEHPGTIVQGRTEPNPRELDQLGPFSRTKLIDNASPFFQTCNIAYPRALLEQLGGFDERFPGAAGEDADLGWRALEQGAERVFDDRILIHHAVEQLGPLGFLRQALRGGDSALVYKRHPELRAQVAYRGVFWARSHARLALALIGALLARRVPAATLLAAPYGKGLIGRARTGGAIWLVPFLVAYDVLEIARSIRGSVRHRVLML